ncbi:MAG: hypothetical protein H7244_04170 [Herminiimonas sp.]|nr:hypothetical protein [Herminiimonas sp.]
MSLINSMLRDLDARKSDGPSAGQFKQHVRAVPDRRDTSGQRRIALVGAALVLAGGAGVAFWLTSAGKAPVALVSDTARLASPQVVAAAASAPAAAPVAAPAVVAAPPVPAVALPAQTASPAPVEAPAPQPTTAPALRKEPEATSLTRTAAASDADRTVATPTATATPRVVSPPSTPSTATAAMALPQKRMTESSPQERADNQYAQALELLRQGKQSAAIQGLEQAVRMSTRQDAARQVLIGALIDMGRKDEAIKNAQDGLVEHVAQPNMAMILARLQLEKGELRPAIITLERTLPYAAERTDYEAFLAALLQRDEQHKQAVEHYLVALQKAPDAGVWWMGLGISYQAMQRPAEAQEAFKRAKNTNSLNAELSAFVDTRLAQLQR